MAGHTLEEQASLLRQCRCAIDKLFSENKVAPGMTFQCGAMKETIGNLRAGLCRYKQEVSSANIDSDKALIK